MVSISKQLFEKVKEKQPSLKEVCDVCHREVPKGTITGWVDNRCSCNKKSLHLPTHQAEGAASSSRPGKRSQTVLDRSTDLEIDRPSSATTWSVDLGERYEVLELLGSGGMGTVYKVRDLKIGAFLAVKVLAKDLASDFCR